MLVREFPPVAQNYSITELELCNIASFSHLFKGVEFDAVMDKLPLIHIMRSKIEPVTKRIKRLLEVLNAYSFDIYHSKGRDMVLIDSLSKMEGNESSTHEATPISFNIQSILTS